jgi:hypothetical protein
MESLRPTLRAVLIISGLLILPIRFRLIFEGFGNLRIQSGTDEPDCTRTFAMLWK